MVRVTLIAAVLALVAACTAPDADQADDAALGAIMEDCIDRCDHECSAGTKTSCVAQCPFGCPPHCCGCQSEKDDSCDKCSDCGSPQPPTDCGEAAMTLEEARQIVPDLTESCYDRCNSCPAYCPDGDYSCPSTMCWINCSKNHHPVCCWGCHGHHHDE
ncbi:MAG: hypothetical protein F4169_20510 [Gammaproteobacteria bacterium]|nr:hypothetical protein [Gammaproteobacteria bacterium]